MNSDFGTNSDSLDASIAEQDRQQCAALRRAINGERIRTLCAIGDELSKLFKQVTTPAWSGPMTESVDRVEKRARLRSLENVPEMKPQSVLLEIWELRRELGE